MRKDSKTSRAPACLGASARRAAAVGEERHQLDVVILPGIGEELHQYPGALLRRVPQNTTSCWTSARGRGATGARGRGRALRLRADILPLPGRWRACSGARCRTCWSRTRV